MAQDKQYLVIYDSQYGFTEQYARWIAEDLGGDCAARKDVNPQQLQKYGGLIYGGGLYAGGVSGLKWFAKQLSSLAGKRTAVFTCGVADPADLKNVAHIREGMAKILTAEQMELPIFHLRGGIDYSRLGFVHKSMMGMLKKMLESKPQQDLTDEDRQILATYGKIVDFTDRASIRPLIEWAEKGED